MKTTEFKSVKEASQRWIDEGKKFKNAINDWLDIIYLDEQSPIEECPEETREDMSGYVLNKIEEYNKDKKYKELRLLFPPDDDPIDWEDIANCISQVSILQDNQLIVTINECHEERWVYIIDDNDIQLIEDGIFMFGKSYDKKYFAKVYLDKIDVCEGWNGKVVSTFKPPKNYGKDFSTKNPVVKDGLSRLNFDDMKIHRVVVFPNGNKVGLASGVGVFILDEKGSQFIQTESDYEVEENDNQGFTFDFEYPHIDVSPDGQYIAAGSQNSPHLVFEKINKSWVITATIEPRSSYPNFVKFNYLNQEKGDQYTGPQLLLSSCHFGQSASIALPINNITANFTASGYDADESLNYVDEKKWVFAAGNYTWGWALGSNDGYIWFKHINGYQLGYLYIGGTVMDIDFSEDRQTIVVASYSGQVIVYKLSELFSGPSLFRHSKNKQEKRRDIYAITNSAYKDVKRYLFLKDHEPMIW